jgi:hypothetical protein
VRRVAVVYKCVGTKQVAILMVLVAVKSCDLLQ